MQMKFAPAILELACDVLIPAALETQIHSGNAGNIKVLLAFKVLFALLIQVSSFTVTRFYTLVLVVQYSGTLGRATVNPNWHLNDLSIPPF